ncbi:MAG: hypothetical protein ABEH83_02075 [Halobacterium sp.]
MDVKNRDGDPVDPIPFLVCACLAVMLSFSLGPLYGAAYGLSVRVSLAVAACCSFGAVAAGFYRLVWTATPRAVTTPAQPRFQRLLYLAVAFGAVVVGLSVPLLF